MLIIMILVCVNLCETQQYLKFTKKKKIESNSHQNGNI